MADYFAWVDPADTTWLPAFKRNDEQTASWTITQEEGDFARLSIDIKNPKVGPLSAGRKFWAWLTVDDTPVFFGRLVAIPSDLLGEVVTFEFRARPADYVAQKAALAESLRVLPFYDPIFIDKEMRRDDDAVLEGYTASYHIDRITHAVTVSDWITGEDGTVTFGAGTVPYDSLQVRLEKAPPASVRVKGSIPWLQSATGTLDFGEIKLASYSTDSLVNNWPKTGDGLAGGYYVVSASAINESPSDKTVSWSISWQNTANKHRDGDTLSVQESFSGPPGFQIGQGIILQDYGQLVPADPATGTPGSSSRHINGIVPLRGQLRATLVLGVDTSRDRKDNAILEVMADLQPVLRDPEDEGETEIIELSAEDASDECTSDSDSAIVNPGRGEYVTTDRGLQSVEYMLARARAWLTYRARAVEVSFNCRFESALNLSLRKNGYIEDERIPGGQAIGKIVSYSIHADGDGNFLGSVKMLCAVGNGNAVEPEDGGEADYVDETYVDDYQTYTGQIVALPSGDVAYSPPVLTGGGGGSVFPINMQNCVVRKEIVSSAPEQFDAMAAVLAAYPPGTVPTTYDFIEKYIEENTRRAQEALANTQMWFELELVDLTGPGIDADWSVPTFPLVIPKQIDLTAA